MKVLFFVDTHGSDSKLHKIIEKSKDVDLLVCAGDFTVFESDMKKILRVLDSIGKPVLIIHGNHETASSVMIECEQLKNMYFIHRTYYISDDIIFYGHGGGGFSTRDEKFTNDTKKFMDELDTLSNKQNKKYKLVLVTHAPAHGTNLDYLDIHVGNKSITEFIINHAPILAVSGHIHETAGYEDTIHKTRLINPGWDGMIINL
ncbi:MAG: metallophosphoesterase family protein [Candidatus Woesearchaeota archaeon]